jgi:hypothetical protein
MKTSALAVSSSNFIGETPVLARFRAFILTPGS